MTSLERADFAAEERQLGLIERRSKMLAASTIVPEPLRNKPADVAAILLTADALGLPLTLATVSQFFVVRGKVVPSAQLMLGLAARRGLEFWWVRCSETVAELAVRRPGAEKVQLFQFTIEEAQRARLTDKDVWKAYPTAMLMARATTRACRAVAPDILLGLPDAEFVEPSAAAPPEVQAAITSASHERDAESVPPEILDATAEAHEYPGRPAAKDPTPREPEAGGGGGVQPASAAAPVEEDFTEAPPESRYAAAVHILATQLKVSDEALDEILIEECGDCSATAVTRENSHRVIARIRQAAGVEAA